MRYFIKRPGNGRASFSLVGPDNKTIKDERVDRVNRDLENGVAIDLLEARMQEIKAVFARKPAAAGLSSLENQRLVQSYIEHSLPLKKRRAPEAFISETKRAVRLVGPLNLLTVERSKLQSRIDGVLLGNPSVQRKTVQTLNQILKYAKRDIHLAKEELPVTDIAHINIVALLLGLGLTPEPFRTLLGAAFATGARFGELFGIKNLEDGMVNIRMQWKIKGKVRDGTIDKRAPLKANKPRDSYVLPELREYVEGFMKLPEETKEMLRRQRNKARYYSLKVWGITLKDLRHSYAVHVAGKGFSKADIAENLGNTEEVVRRHYSDFIKTKEQASRYARIYSKG